MRLVASYNKQINRKCLTKNCHVIENRPILSAEAIIMFVRSKHTRSSKQFRSCYCFSSIWWIGMKRRWWRWAGLTVQDIKQASKFSRCYVIFSDYGRLRRYILIKLLSVVLKMIKSDHQQQFNDRNSAIQMAWSSVQQNNGQLMAM